MELEPIRNPAKATAPTVARGVNKLHKCVEAGFARQEQQLAAIRKALHIDEDGNKLKGSSPLFTLNTQQAAWRGGFAVFGGISATLVVWRALFALWPAVAEFGTHVLAFMNTGHP